MSPNLQTTVSDCMLLKQGDADSFSFMEILVVIKLHL